MIPHVYEEHGADFPAALSGMFAIALWDRPRERLVLARDRVGKKPLHYRLFPDGSLAFASELKSLLLLPQIARRARSRRARRVPRPPVRARRGDRCRRHQTRPAGTRPRVGGRTRRDTRVLGAPAGAGRARRRRMAGARPRDRDRRRPPASRERRPAGRASLGRDRLVDRRRPDGAGVERAREDVHGRRRGRPLRRARARESRRRAPSAPSTRSWSSSRIPWSSSRASPASSTSRSATRRSSRPSSSPRSRAGT